MIPPIYPITDTRISVLTHLEQVERLIDGGATLIQLREKHASAREFYEQAVKCVEYARPKGVKIIVNDRVDIAMMTGADGVHLGQDDMPVAAARDLLGNGKIIGYSTHSVEQAIAAAALGVDYVAIGPIFQTHTKEDPDAAVDLGGVAAVRCAIGSVPLVAIGGINMANLYDVTNAGADSVAIISGILTDPQGITAAMRQLRNSLNNVQK
ncbi:MAG: thiamine phosphate synthase [Pyrinomonadaceae bacterium]